MGFFQDTVAVFKKRDLTFVESRKEAEGVYSFVFEKDSRVNWTAGQYGLFTITHVSMKGKKIRPFSLSSAPAENKIQITVGIGDQPSEFKQALLGLQKGMKIRMSDPIGSFNLVEKAPTLLVAGGIGITPFRSMLKQLETEGKAAGKQLTLLYMDSKKNDLFKDELDRIADKISARIVYVDSREALQQEIDKYAGQHKDNGKYFVAGSKSIVDAVFAQLQTNKVSKKNLKKDVFFGY